FSAFLYQHLAPPSVYTLSLHDALPIFSRVGPQLAGALIFVFLTANFYAMLATRVSGIDVSSESFRNRVSPLNTPTDPNLVAAVRDRKSTRLNSSHVAISYAVFRLNKKT